MAKPVLTTSKMPGETEQQYTAWLLYCEYGSIEKLHRTWQETEGRPRRLKGDQNLKKLWVVLANPRHSLRSKNGL